MLTGLVSCAKLSVIGDRLGEGGNYAVGLLVNSDWRRKRSRTVSGQIVPVDIWRVLGDLGAGLVNVRVVLGDLGAGLVNVRVWA